MLIKKIIVLIITYTLSVVSYAVQWGAVGTGDKDHFRFSRPAGYHLASTIDGGSKVWTTLSDENSIDTSQTYLDVYHLAESGNGWLRTARCNYSQFGGGGCRTWTNEGDKIHMIKGGVVRYDLTLKMKDVNKEKVHLMLQTHHFSGDSTSIPVDTDLYVKGASCLAETDPVWEVGSFTKGIREQKNFNFSIRGAGNSIGYLELKSNDLNNNKMVLGGNGPVLKFKEAYEDMELSYESCQIKNSTKMCTVGPKLGETINVSGTANATDSPPGSFTSAVKATLTCD